MTRALRIAGQISYKAKLFTVVLEICTSEFDVQVGLHKENVFYIHGFKQQVFEPTHISGGFLDQIFTFSLDKSLSSSVNVDSASKIDSDHFPVYCSISLLLMKKTVKYLKYRNLKMVDKNEFANDYKAVLNDLDLKNGRFGDIYVELQHNTNVILNKHAPLINKKYQLLSQHHGLIRNIEP